MATPETIVNEWDPDALDTDEMILQMGPQHPATHGVLRVELRTDGEIVKAARPHIGYLHRCFEKHCENVDYNGVMPYADRMDYCAAMGNTLGFALAVEKLHAIQVSPYVDTVRVIMAELQRIASHTVAVGTYTAVDRATLSVGDGEFVAIVGPTGCGKSTLLNIAAGLLAPAAGSVNIFGAPLATLNRQAGYLFQAEALFPWKTALDNVAIGLETAGVRRAQARD